MKYLRELDFTTHRSRFVLLGTGALLMFLTRERWAVHLLAWLAPVPFLLFLRTGKGWRHALIFVGVYCVANIVAAGKSFMPPWPRFMAIAFGVPIGMAFCTGYLLWSRMRRHIPPWMGNLMFAAVMIIMEWLVYMFTPYGTINAAANTQLDNLPLLQFLSLAGVGGLGFLIYWFAAIVAEGICDKRIPVRQGMLIGGIIISAHIWGAYRIGNYNDASSATVAAVQTDFDWFATPEIPPLNRRKVITEKLFQRTERAAEMGAQMVVWNEISNMVNPPDEPAIIKRAQTIAKHRRIHIALSYLKLLSETPILWENKYVWINPKGQLVDTYLKHKPAIPIEPAVKGVGVPKVAQTGFGKAAGAICFDFDFPQIGLTLARAGVDFAFVPGADSPSIDPYHTQIAAMRAIEGGYSVIRSARHGTSAGIDQFGRIRGWLSANESDQKILLVTIPTKAEWTLYKTVGDLIVWISIAFLLGIAGWILWRKAL